MFWGSHPPVFIHIRKELMNPWDLSASDLLVWGIVLHLIADWPLQNDWMANNKMKRRERWRRRWNDHAGTQPKNRLWDRHPAAYVHSGIHGLFLALVFGWAAIPLAIAHLIIDTRAPVALWSRLIKQKQPGAHGLRVAGQERPITLYDMGTEVRIWTDQVFHIICIAVAALLIA